MNAFDALRRHGLSFPEAAEDHPWGHSALKVRAKTFAWLDQSGDRLSITVKLPVSRDFAILSISPSQRDMAFAGAAGSVCRFQPGEAPDLTFSRGG